MGFHIIQICRKLIPRCIFLTRKLQSRMMPNSCTQKSTTTTTSTFIQRPSNKVFFQVLSTGYEDVSPSLLLFTDSQRYLFNCGEGTQRLFNECKVKLGRLDKIFLSSLDWECIGGLPGMAMTLRDAGKSKLSLFGPSGLEQFINATRSFLRHEKVLFDLHECTETNSDVYTDTEVIISPILIESSQTQTCFLNNMKLSDESYNHITPQTGKKILCYKGQLPPLPGKFLAKKALSFGVAKGPKFGDLQRGMSVASADGSTVTPDMVMEAPRPGPAFCIIDCPSQDFISSLISNDEINKLFTKDQSAIVIHLANKEIVDKKEYREWIKSSPSSVFHWIVNQKRSSGENVCFPSRYSIQCRLHGVDSHLFPLTDQDETDAVKTVTNNERNDDNTFNIANHLDRFNLRPQTIFGLKRDLSTPPLNTTALINEGKLLVGSTNIDYIRNISSSILKSHHCNRKRSHSDSEDCIDTSRISDNNIECDKNHIPQKHDFPKVVFLGTGAAMPSKYRNVSGIFIRVSENDSVLFDCGEGTFGQLVSHYGSQTSNILRTLRCIFISHLHADHHLGLMRILTHQLQHVKMESQFPVVVAPYKLWEWLAEYSELTQELAFRFIDSDSGLDNNIPLITCHGPNSLQLRTARVEHFGKSYGCSLEMIGQWKITYSGDAMPSESLIEIGQDSTLLIHEATLEDGMEEEAKLKQHSTVGQALSVAKDMKAERTMLTHFSQRYPKIPSCMDALEGNVGIAFDHLEVGLNDVKRLNQLLPTLEILFSEDDNHQNEHDGVNIAANVS